jgi:hypothetical protein
MADQEQKQQRQAGPATGAEAGSRNQKEYGTSEVDVRQGTADQSTKDKIAQGINLHKDQYPQIQENPSSGSAQARDQAGEAGTSEKSV